MKFQNKHNNRKQGIIYYTLQAYLTLYYTKTSEMCQQINPKCKANIQANIRTNTVYLNNPNPKAKNG